MSTQSVGWVRVGASPPAARAVFVTLAVVGHLLFLRSLTWTIDPKGIVAALLALPNVVALVGVAFRPRRVPIDPWRGLGVVVAVTTFVGVTAWVIAAGGVGFDATILLTVLGVGLVCGALGATVAVPLSVALDRWRSEPTPRRALDAWATLLCVAAVFAFVRPFGLARAIELCQHAEGGPGCRDFTLGRVLARLDLAATLAAVASAAGLWSFERKARRWLAAARAGGIPGYRMADADLAAAAAAPQWGLLDEGPERALLSDAGDASYRDSAGGAVVARIPLRDEASWREQAMLIVMLLGAAGMLWRVLS